MPLFRHYFWRCRPKVPKLQRSQKLWQSSNKLPLVYRRGEQLFSCDYNNRNHIPILNLNGDDYIVHTIFYQNKPLVASNTAFSTPNSAACFSPLRKPSLSTDFFLTPNQTQVLLNSSSTGSVAAQKSTPVGFWPCLQNDANQGAKVSEKCGTGSSHVLELPVKKYDRRENEGMKDVLSRGFMLSWIASDCTFCKSTGGKCGFDYPSYHFKCFFALIGPTAPAATTVAGIGLFLIVILYYLRKKPFTDGSLEKFIFDEKNATESSQRLNWD